MHERFLSLADEYLAEYLGKIKDSVGRLSEEQVWWKASDASNSVGNLLLHLCGNLSQWVLAALGGQPFARDRPQEFRANGSATRDEMVRRLEEVVEGTRAVVRGLDPTSLKQARAVQGYDTDGMGVVFHVVEHMSYHTGQIVFVAKQLLGPAAKIEFYPDLTPTRRSQETRR